MSDWPKGGVRGFADGYDATVWGERSDGGDHPVMRVWHATDAKSRDTPVVIRTADQDAARSAVIEAAREVLWAFDEAWGDNAHRTMGALRAALEQTEGGE